MSRRALREGLWQVGAVALMAAAPHHLGAQATAPATVITLRTEGPNLEFLPALIAARAGTRVVLRYVNGGDLPHNLAIVRDEADIDMLVNAAYEAQGTGFIPVDMADRMIAYTPLLSPGDSVDLELVVPPPGSYTYICLFPGHANMMLGTLRSIG